MRCTPSKSAEDALDHIRLNIYLVRSFIARLDFDAFKDNALARRRGRMTARRRLTHKASFMSGCRASSDWAEKKHAGWRHFEPKLTAPPSPKRLTRVLTYPS